MGPREARNGRYDFRGYVFPVAVSCDGVSGADRTSLSKRVDGDLLCPESQFLAPVYLSGIHITGSASFDSARFSYQVELRKADLGGKLDFSGTRVAAAVHLGNASLHGGADFWAAELGGLLL